MTRSLVLTRTKERIGRGDELSRRTGRVTTSVYNLPGYFRLMCSKVCLSGDTVIRRSARNAGLVFENPHFCVFYVPAFSGLQSALQSLV